MRTLTSVCLVWAVVATPAWADGEWEVLISTADASVPGVPGAVWLPNGLGKPTISLTGDVSFQGRIGGAEITMANSRLILRGTPGRWEIVARDGSPVPGDLIPGYVFNQASGLNGLASSNNLTADGGVLASGFVNGPDVTSGTDTAAFIVHPGGEVGLLGREGDPYPGGGGSVMSSSMSLGSGVQVSDGGLCLFSTTLSGGDVSGSTNDSALVVLAPSGATPIFRKGDPAPGLTDGTTMNPDSFGLHLKGSQYVLFGGTLVGGELTPETDHAVFVTVDAKPGELRMLCREGSPVPGMPGVHYRSGASFGFPLQPLNNCGIYFLAELEGEGVVPNVNDLAVFFQVAGQQEVLLRRGDPVPGVPPDEAVFRTMNPSGWTTVWNGGGYVAYQGLLQSPDGSNLSAGTFVACLTPDGVVHTICRSGGPVPGVEGATFGNLDGDTSIGISQSGVVVFQNSVVTSGGNVQHLFAWDEADGLRVIAAVGDTNFTGTPATQLSLIGPSGQNGDGGGSGLSPSGMLVIRAEDSVNQIHAIAEIQLGESPFDCSGDFSIDGVVDAADLAVLLGAWGACSPKGACEADLNQDGEVDGDDLTILLGNWGPCAPASLNYCY